MIISPYNFLLLFRLYFLLVQLKEYHKTFEINFYNDMKYYKKIYIIRVFLFFYFTFYSLTHSSSPL